MPQAIHISPIDNVVVALHPIAKGTLVEVDGLAVTALEDIPQGHKMAVKPIRNGENVIKYGFPIGHATADAEPGTWMHTHNVHTNLSGEVEYSYNPSPELAPLPKVEAETFMGFRRKDGRAAIRNEIWIIPTVGCVNDIAKKMVADNQDLVTGTIEGLYTFTHPFGCSQTGHDHAQTRKLLAALVRHPNAAAVLVLHLGCENLQHDQFVEELGEYDHDRVKFLTCQDVDDEFAAALAITVFKKDISSLCFVSLSAISLRCFRSTSAICRLWSACMVCILSCRASMVSSWSATSLCRAVFSLSNVLTLLLPKREPTLSAMLAAATVAAPFSFSVCISFFARLSSSRAVSFCCCKSTTSALRSSESFCISR